jgi:hypothetical protein
MTYNDLESRLRSPYASHTEVKAWESEKWKEFCPEQTTWEAYKALIVNQARRMRIPERRAIARLHWNLPGNDVLTLERMGLTRRGLRAQVVQLDSMYPSTRDTAQKWLIRL